MFSIVENIDIVTPIAISLPNFKGILGILFAVFVFGFLIFIHELGHFLTAKKANIKVTEFAIGMGPTVFKKEVGETTYALRLLPFGGFVAMDGENETSDNSRSFRKANIPKRAVVMSAGAIMNIVFGFLLVLGLTVYQASAPGAKIDTTKIDSFYETSVTNQWLKAEDQIVRVNGKKTNNFSDLTYRLSRDKDGVIDITVLRNGEEVLLKGVIFERKEIAEGYIQNVLDFRVKGDPITVPNTIKYSFIRTGDFIRQIWSSLGDLVTGNVSVDQMSGPIGITKEVGQVTSSGNWSDTIMFIALISLNLGVLNLMPLPILDGGKLLLLLIEAIRGKAINEKLEMYINLAGFVLMFGLMIIVTFNDILKLF